MTLLHTSLLAAAGKGDPAARERLLALCAPVIRNVARQTLSWDYFWDAEDAEQTSRLAFIACAVQHSRTSAAGFTGYAATAALRDCLRERRLYHRGWTLPHRPAEDAACIDADEPSEDAASVPSPEAAVLQSEESARLQELVERLPSELRDTLIRRYGLGGREPETQTEVAAALGVTRDTIRWREQQALAALRVAIKRDQ